MPTSVMNPDGKPLDWACIMIIYTGHHNGNGIMITVQSPHEKMWKEYDVIKYKLPDGINPNKLIDLFLENLKKNNLRDCLWKGFFDWV